MTDLHSISVSGIQAHLGQNHPFSVEVFETLASTNTYMLQQLQAGTSYPLGHCVIAHLQTHGRGQRGKHWVSRPGNLYFSMFWQIRKSATGIEGLSQAIGVAFARWLATLGIQVTLKSPNDVLVAGRKLAGVLIETRTTTKDWQVVVGIGCNLRASDTIQAQISQPITDLQQHVTAMPTPEACFADLYRAVYAVLSEFSRAGWAAFADPWQQLAQP